jgi:ABC-type multidrug transport system fused ATPase/permease subunit
VSLRDNILFGEKYDKVRLRKALKASQLKADIAILPDGLETCIGERGINLSGGVSRALK